MICSVTKCAPFCRGWCRNQSNLLPPPNCRKGAMERRFSAHENPPDVYIMRTMPLLGRGHHGKPPHLLLVRSRTVFVSMIYDDNTISQQCRCYYEFSLSLEKRNVENFQHSHSPRTEAYSNVKISCIHMYIHNRLHAHYTSMHLNNKYCPFFTNYCPFLTNSKSTLGVTPTPSRAVPDCIKPFMIR